MHYVLYTEWLKFNAKNILVNPHSGWNVYLESAENFCRPKRLENIINTSLAAPGALSHRLHRRTTSDIQNGHQGAPK